MLLKRVFFSEWVYYILSQILLITKFSFFLSMKYSILRLNMTDALAESYKCISELVLNVVKFLINHCRVNLTHLTHILSCRSWGTHLTSALWRQKQAELCLSLRSAWPIEWAPVQPRLQREQKQRKNYYRQKKIPNKKNPKNKQNILVSFYCSSRQGRRSCLL